MKAAFLPLIVIFALALAAQQPPAANQQAGENPPTPAVQPQTTAPAGLQLGHPLDPNDVNVLTGKSQTAIPAAARAGYAGGYPAMYYPNGYIPMFGNGPWDGGKRWNDLRFFRNFGLFNPRGFFVFGLGGHGLGPGVVPLFNSQPAATTGTSGRHP